MTIDKQELFDNLHEFEKSIISMRTAISNLTVIDFDENSDGAAKFYYEYKDAKDIMTQKLEGFEKVVSDKIKADSENLKAKFKEEIERVKSERAEAVAAAKTAEEALNKIAETYRKDELARLEAARIAEKEKAEKEALEAKEAEASAMVATAEPETVEERPFEGGVVFNYAEKDDLNDNSATEESEEATEENTKPKRSRSKK